MPVRLNQAEYRIRSDQTAFNPGTPVWVTTQNQSTPLNWPEAKTFRIRFSIQNTGNQATSTNTWSIWVSRNSGAYSQVTTTSAAVRMDPTASSDVGVITLTTPLLTNPGGTFLNGLATDDNNATSPLSLPGSRYTEFEFGMRLVLLGVNDNDTLDFQVRFNGAVLNTYTITPRIIVYIDDGIGVAQGDAVATATGLSIRIGIGAAAGDSTALGYINLAKSSIGAASGDSTAVGQITGFSLGRGLAQGDAVAGAIGTNAITHTGDGLAQGDAVAGAIGVETRFAEGLAAGDATASGVITFTGNGTIHAVGAASGDAAAAANGTGPGVGSAAGDSAARAIAFHPPRKHRVWHMQTRIGQRVPHARTEITQ